MRIVGGIRITPLDRSADIKAPVNHVNVYYKYFKMQDGFPEPMYIKQTFLMRLVKNNTFEMIIHVLDFLSIG